MSHALDTGQALLLAIEKSTKLARALRRANDSQHIKKDTPSLLFDAAEMLDAIASTLQAFVVSVANPEEIADEVISRKLQELDGKPSGNASEAPAGPVDPPTGNS